MHAVFTSVTVDESALDPEHTLLRERLVPAAQAAPGAVTGYWIEPDENMQGMAVVVFESEAEAQQAVSAMNVEVGSSIAPGVTFTHVQIGEVIGHF